jgi:uncharacterized membrane protein
MNVLLRALRLLTIVVWVGGLIFFAFVEAPTAVHVMGTDRQFAQLINGSITALNRLGQTCGFVFFFATLATTWRHNRDAKVHPTLAAKSDVHRRKLLRVEMFLVLLMIVATDYVQAGIIPAMERDRASAGGDIAAIPTTNPARADFDRLHALSEKVEGSALLLGLTVVILMAAEPIPPRQLES